MSGRGLRFTAVVLGSSGEELDRRQFSSSREVAEWLGYTDQYVRVMFAAGLGKFERSRVVDGETQTCTVTRTPRSQF